MRLRYEKARQADAVPQDQALLSPVRRTQGLSGHRYPASGRSSLPVAPILNYRVALALLVALVLRRLLAGHVMHPATQSSPENGALAVYMTPVGNIIIQRWHYVGIRVSPSQ